jgi:peptide chain release factor 2
MTNEEKEKDLQTRTETLKRVLHIEQLQEDIKTEELQTQAADFWEDAKKAEKILKKISEKRAWVSLYQDVKKSVDDLKIWFEFFSINEISENELEKNIAETEKILAELEFKNMLRNEEDRLSAIININSGAGGTESCDWANMLYRMYLRWAEKHFFKVSVIDYIDGDVAGIKSVSLEINGDFVYGYLKGESGVHRLVRLSPFDSANKRHTSFASVFAYPVIDDNIEININSADIEWDTFRSSGPVVKTLIRWKQPCVFIINHQEL